LYCGMRLLRRAAPRNDSGVVGNDNDAAE